MESSLGSPVGSRSSPKRSQSGSEEDAEQVRRRFRQALVSRYRTIAGAWRELDPGLHGRISFFDFCRACREMGYERETKQLWTALDRNEDGFVSLEELDAGAAKLLGEFSEAVVKAHGSAEAAWLEHFPNLKGFGRCTADAFSKACRDLEYSGPPDAVYALINSDKSAAGVSFKDFILLDRWFRPQPPAGRWDYSSLRPTISPA
mmetsp:Transcript_44118/g.93947  ORF Transcript_44118/g.93947 Transcript_44118/m.93947 type:complete len:204 (-) Transcript_44118:76-687(-)